MLSKETDAVLSTLPLATLTMRPVMEILPPIDITEPVAIASTL